MLETAAKQRIVRLHRDDNVVVTTAPLPAATALEGEGVTVARPVPSGHKIATRRIGPGEAVVKFGQIIGYATGEIAPGEHVHVHNCGMGEHDQNYRIGSDYRPLPLLAEAERARFLGIPRPDGRVGTRNFIALCATVNCSASVVRYVADRVNHSGLLERYPNVDGVIALSHATGCGMAGSGEGFDNLERVLWGYATHPNVGAALFVGLGCEVMQIARLKAKYDLSDTSRFHTLTIQEGGGTRRTIESAVAKIEELLPLVDAVRRPRQGSVCGRRRCWPGASQPTSDGQAPPGSWSAYGS